MSRKRIPGLLERGFQISLVSRAFPGRLENEGDPLIDPCPIEYVASPGEDAVAGIASKPCSESNSMKGNSEPIHGENRREGIPFCAVARRILPRIRESS